MAPLISSSLGKQLLHDVELEGSNDVDEDNKGIFIQVDDQARTRAEGWVVVSWDNFREIRFQH